MTFRSWWGMWVIVLAARVDEAEQQVARPYPAILCMGLVHSDVAALSFVVPDVGLVDASVADEYFLIQWQGPYPSGGPKAPSPSTGAAARSP